MRWMSALLVANLLFALGAVWIGNEVAMQQFGDDPSAEDREHMAIIEDGFMATGVFLLILYAVAAIALLVFGLPGRSPAYALWTVTLLFFPIGTVVAIMMAVMMPDRFGEQEAAKVRA